jgi:hypothetical protein
MSFQPSSELSRERDKLLRRVRGFRKYQILCILALVIFLIVSSYLAFLSGASQKASYYYRNWEFLVFVVTFSVFGILARKALAYEISKEERLFLTVYSAVEDLGVYIEDKREFDRKRAQKKVEQIQNNIEIWRVGGLRLCQSEIGSHLKAFKETFYTKMVAAVRKGKEDDVVHAFQILQTFAKYLLNSEPKIKDLDFITTAMNGISVTIPSKTPAPIKIFHSLKEPTLFRHIVWVIIAVVSACVIGYIGYIAKVPIEYNYPLAVTVGLGIILGYWNSLRK